MEKNISVHARLKGLLRENEHILWSSETERFPLLAQDAEIQILGKWTGTCVVTLVVLWLYVGSGGTNPGVIGPIVLIAAALLISPVLEYRRLLRQQYWITDQRAILLSASGTFYYLELSEIHEFQVIRSKGGMNCLALGGEAVENSGCQMRWRACHPMLRKQNGGETVKAEGMVFFAVESIRAAEALLSQRIAKTAA